MPKSENKTDPIKVILLGSGDRRPKILDEAKRIRPLISELVEIVDEDFTYDADMSKCEADIAIVLGGDGSILRAAKQMGPHQIPVLGLNLGKLGFLADIHPDSIVQAIQSIIDEKHKLCLLYTSPSPRDRTRSRMPSSA